MHFRNPLAMREQRMMADGNERRRIDGIRTRIFEMAVRCNRDPLNFEQRSYLSHLCGRPQGGFTKMTPEDKARIGNLFEKACSKHRADVAGLTARELPGLEEVPHNRALVRAAQKQAGKENRQYRRE